MVCNVKLTHNALISGHIYKPNRPLVHDISHFIAKIKPKMTEFQYFIKTSVKNGEIIEARQLYFDYHLWYLIRPNYWGCTKCRTYISTNGNELKNKDLPLPTHSAHTLTSPDEFKIK